MAITNTVQDFLDTSKTRGSIIICPACGSRIGITEQGTYDMVLTPNARLELDGSINDLRSFLEGIEKVLAQINIYGVKPIKANSPYNRIRDDYPSLGNDGVYTTPGAKEIEDYIGRNIDYFEWQRLLYRFPRQGEFAPNNHPNSPESKETVQQMLKRGKEILVKGLEPATGSGPLVNLIFEQWYISQWMRKYSRQQDKLNALLEEVCPNLQWYLNQLVQLDRYLNPDDPDANLREGVLRVQFLLGILLGHRSETHIQVVSDLGIDTNDAFKLPRRTFVTPELLQDFLRSEVALRNSNLGLDRRFVDAVRQSDLTAQMGNRSSSMGNMGGNGKSNLLPQMIELMGGQITKLVHFSCAGPIGDKPAKNAYNVVQFHEVEKCGWYPKPENTHSVVLIGSPGTSKTTSLLTGFTTFYEFLAAIGATIIFDSPDDEARMSELRQDYFRGKMPEPSPIGFRKSIKFSVEFTTEPYKKTNFVFTDIPGEVAAASLTEKGPDPAVLRILKNAEHITFFFDLSIEPSLREKLTKGDEENFWQVVEENYNKVDAPRKQRAAVSQLQLLQKFVSDLQSQKGTDGLQGTKFTCVIPKADLFSREDEPKRAFFTDFFKRMAQQQVIVPSRHYRGESFSGLHSVGGFGAQVSRAEGIELQKEIGKFVSQEALKCLARIGDALGDEQQFEPLKSALTETLRVRLVAMLEKAFGQDNVYFLPISAQGENSKSSELGHPPNQKLSEYVFILPVALSAERLGEASERVRPVAAQHR